jgi:hypothetical protein
VFPEATAAHVRERVALAPRDLVLAAYGDLRGKPLPGSRDTPLDSPDWHWIFRPFPVEVLRRAHGAMPWTTMHGHGIPWGRAGAEEPVAVRRGDIVLTEDGPAILRRDDGDGWLDNGDRAVRVRDGQLAIDELEGLAGNRVRILRPEDFRELRAQLTAAGYGELGFVPVFGTDVERALQDFQRDQGREPTGRPDEETRAALSEFLARLEAAEEEAPSGASETSGP